MEIEYCRLTGTPYTGGAADIYKCFDQVRRDIVYRLLEEAGMPKQLVNTYRNFLEALTVRNTVAGGLGESYTKPTSIPQGDPMSMMVTSLLLRPWVMQMKSLKVKPRILADDLQLMCTGEGHLDTFTTAFDATHQHLEDMGAKLAPKKSITWSSSAAARKWLSTHRWDKPRRTIKVITDGRDLGAHMSAAANRIVGTTLTNRMQKVSDELEVLNRVKAPYSRKAMIIRSAKLPKALYGCEVAPANELVLQKLRTRLTKTLAYTTEQRSADLTFASCSGGPDLDPDIQILARRAIAFRRFFTRRADQQEQEDISRGHQLLGDSKSKHVGWQGSVIRNGKLARTIFRKYQERNEPGVFREEDDKKPKVDGGDPATKARSAIRRGCKPMGPIGLLLESIHLQAASLDPSWRIVQYNQQPIDLIEGSAHLVLSLIHI